MTRLTLCLIARDEERFLEACLDSVREAVDAIVVVDTGSRDATVAIAERAGAQVVHHAWDDDFAAARNAALEHVARGYVLALDADERLAPGCARRLRKIVARGRLDGALLPFHNAARADAAPEEVLDGRARLGEPTLLARLFRRTPDLRWEGRVHEHVTAWARGRLIEAIDVPLVHYGAVPELRVRLGKGRRNLRLLERACEEHPDNAVYRTYLARDLLEAGEVGRARGLAEEAWALLEDRHGAGEAAPDAVPLGTMRTFLALRAGDLELARRTLEQTRAWSGDHPNLDLLQCVHAERALLCGLDFEADSEVARAAIAAGERALGEHARLFAAQLLPGATSWATETRLGTLHLLLHEPGPALPCFERALAARPDCEEARLGRAEALILTGRAAEVIAEGEPLVASGTPDGWILAAIATLHLGGSADLLPFLERARTALSLREPLAPHRRWYLEELWDQLQLTGARP